MTDVIAAEYLYELHDANWEDGPLGNWKILAHPITKKTAKRIYFTYLNSRRPSFVDRQKIEADGEVYHGYTMRRLHLTPPEISDYSKRPSLQELRRAMADAHPDRGGTNEGFIAARERYEHAAAKSKNST